MRILSLILFVIVSFSSFAQQCSDTIYMVGKKCYQNEKLLNQTELGKLFKPIPLANQSFKKYNNKVAGDILLSGITGFCLGYGLAPFLFPSNVSNNSNQRLVIVVLGLSGLVWSLSLQSEKEGLLMQAIKGYNNQLQTNCK